MNCYYAGCNNVAEVGSFCKYHHNLIERRRKINPNPVVVGKDYKNKVNLGSDNHYDLVCELKLGKWYGFGVK